MALPGSLPLAGAQDIAAQTVGQAAKAKFTRQLSPDFKTKISCQIMSLLPSDQSVAKNYLTTRNNCAATRSLRAASQILCGRVPESSAHATCPYVKCEV